MDILKLIEDITLMLNLDENDIITVSKRTFKAFNKLQILYKQLSQKLIKLTSALEKAQKRQLEFIKTNCEFDLSNKEEVSIYFKGDKIINELNKRIRSCEHDIKMVENTMKMIMKTNSIVRNIIDYDMFIKGAR